MAFTYFCQAVSKQTRLDVLVLNPALANLQNRQFWLGRNKKLITEVETQAHAILEALIQADFSNCAPMTREFAGLTTKPGIYAVRHRTEGLLYIGKAQDIKERFRNCL